MPQVLQGNPWLLTTGRTRKGTPEPPIAASRLAEGGFAMAHNDSLGAPAAPRQWLRLSTSSDALRWHDAPDIRRGAQGEEFSYPSLLQIGRQLHVTFTAQRAAIGHQVYDIVAAVPAN